MINIIQNIICSDCKREKKAGEDVCSHCGSSRKTINLTLSAKVNIYSAIGGKVKKYGIKRVIKEFKIGASFNRDRNKFVERTWVLDRENNKYFECIIDKQTGKIIHECIEPLNEHRDHGNAKKK